MCVPGNENNIKLCATGCRVSRLARACYPGNRETGLRKRWKKERPLTQGRSCTIVLVGYSLMSMVINEEAEPGHSISLGVGVYPVTAGLTTNNAAWL